MLADSFKSKNSFDKYYIIQNYLLSDYLKDELKNLIFLFLLQPSLLAQHILLLEPKMLYNNLLQCH